MAIRLRDRKQVLLILSQNHSLAYSCRVVGIFSDLECLPGCNMEWRNFLVIALAIIVWQSCCPAQAGEFEIRLASKEKADGYQSLPLADGVAPVFVDSAICLTEDDFVNATLTRRADQFGLDMTIKRKPARRLKKLTAENIGESLAIIIDGVIISAPVIRSESGAKVFLTGFRDRQQSQRLADLVNKMVD